MRVASVRGRWLWVPTLVMSTATALPPPAAAQPRRPVYVGAKVCATCHDGESMGHQTTH